MFEIRTILLFSSSLKIILGILLLAYSLKNKSFKPTQYIALGNIISGLGLLIHSQFPYPSEVINLMLLNTMIVIGDGLFIVGLWALRNKIINKYFLPFLLVISLSQVYFFTEVWRHDGIRVALNSTIYALIGFFALKEFILLLKDRVKPLYYTITIILLTHCLILIIRAIFTISNPHIDLMTPSPIGTFMHLYIVLSQTSAVFCYAIIVNQLLREDLAKSLEEQKKLQSLKDDLSSMIVHDLKNPLNALLNYTDFFDVKKTNITVTQASSQMLNLVSNLLDISRYEESKMPVSISSIRLYDILASSIQQVKIFYEQKNISIELRTIRDITIYADPYLLDRVLTNLLSNAIKFSPINTSISLTVEVLKEFVKVSITDKGEGIDSKYHSLIFEKYNQAPLKNSGISSSTGIGLTFCKIAIEAQRGAIGIESQRCKGSTFWITIPLADKALFASEQNFDKEEFKITQSKLSNEEKVKLNSIANSLENISVFELSKINNQLSQINTENNQNIKLWANDLLQAVYSCNEEKYKMLIKMVLE